MKRVSPFVVYLGAIVISFGIQAPAFPSWDLLGSALVALVFSLAIGGGVLMLFVHWRGRNY